MLPYIHSHQNCQPSLIANIDKTFETNVGVKTRISGWAGPPHELLPNDGLLAVPPRTLSQLDCSGLSRFKCFGSDICNDQHIDSSRVPQETAKRRSHCRARISKVGTSEMTQPCSSRDFITAGCWLRSGVSPFEKIAYLERAGTQLWWSPAVLQGRDCDS